MNRLICFGAQKKSNGLKRQLDYKETSSKTLPNSGVAARTLQVQGAGEPWFIRPLHLDSTDGNHSWPGASVSLGTLVYSGPGCPGYRKKKKPWFKHLEYKGTSP